MWVYTSNRRKEIDYSLALTPIQAHASPCVLAKGSLYEVWKELFLHIFLTDP